MRGLSRGMPADRKEAVLLAADLADDMPAVVHAVRRYDREGHRDMAVWTGEAYLILCAVDFLFHESRWTT